MPLVNFTSKPEEGLELKCKLCGKILIEGFEKSNLCLLGKTKSQEILSNKHAAAYEKDIVILSWLGPGTPLATIEFSSTLLEDTVGLTSLKTALTGCISLILETCHTSGILEFPNLVPLLTQDHGNSRLVICMPCLQAQLKALSI